MGTKCNYVCERANGCDCEMAQPHYRISQAAAAGATRWHSIHATKHRILPFFVLGESTKSATISIQFGTIRNAHLHHPPTHATRRPEVFRKHCWLRTQSHSKSLFNSRRSPFGPIHCAGGAVQTFECLPLLLHPQPCRQRGEQSVPFAPSLVFLCLAFRG